MFLSSRDADVKVFALPDIWVAGNPKRLTNIRKLRKNDCTIRSGVNSRWIALVEAQVYKQTQVLSAEHTFHVSHLLETYKGLKKSRPVCANGGDLLTLKLGKSGRN